MVTHDRYFLDSIANRIIEIDRGALYSYDTNYAGFLERKAQREEIDQAADRKRRSILRNELAWVMRGARARSTKQKARLERFEDLKGQQAEGRDRNCRDEQCQHPHGQDDSGTSEFIKGVWRACPSA